MDNLCFAADHDVLEVNASIAGQIPYGVRMIGAEMEWAETRGAGVKVAVLDTGRPNHRDLRIAGSVDFTNTHVDDRNGHATHVCGTVGANGGILGVAPECELYAVKVLPDFSGGSFDWVTQGIHWCVDNKMDVIVMSLGGIAAGDQLTRLQEAVCRAKAANIIIVAAAGNASKIVGRNTVMHPALLDEVIATAAVDVNEQRANFSSVGPEVEIAAAGVQIRSTHLNNTYALLSGTSMACPHIAGAAALMIAKARLRRKVVSAEAIRYSMGLYADDLFAQGRDEYSGFGVFSFERFEDLNLLFTVGSREYIKNGVIQQALIAPQVIEGRTMMGLRDLGEALGCNVLWQPPNMIRISKM